MTANRIASVARRSTKPAGADGERHASVVKETPISAVDWEVQAILAGRKSTFRKPVRPQPPSAFPVGWIKGDAALWSAARAGDFPMWDTFVRSPFGKVGDRLWVRETFCPVNDVEFGGDRWIDYRATPRYNADHPAGWHNAPDDPCALKWRPSTQMPRAASRIMLEITNLEVQRLDDVTHRDALHEGIPYDVGVSGGDPLSRFLHWFSRAHKVRQIGKHINPWLWVVHFARVEARAPRE